MLSKLAVYTQYLVPQHLISIVVGALANCRIKWFKNAFIKLFINLYHVDMQEAVDPNYKNYACFNDFFIRHIRLENRPIVKNDDWLLSPADGSIAQFGITKLSTEMHVKGNEFNLKALLANDQELTDFFVGGSFITIYLAPYDYHRVHMPISGKLEKSIFVPGKLFSVNKTSSTLIPNIYSRNERYISVFDTEQHGKIAVIMVGALIVGSIRVTWQSNPVRTRQQHSRTYDKHQLGQVDELGCFLLGSTVIVLTQANRFSLANMVVDQKIKLGEILARPPRKP